MLFKKDDTVLVPLDEKRETFNVGKVVRFRMEVEMPDGSRTLCSPEGCYLVADKEVVIPCRPQNL